MAREPLQTLTEPMFYLLISLQEERAGTDIVKYIEEVTDGRIKIGPGTLYALLARFVDEELIRVSSIMGKRKNYLLTDEGKEQLMVEYKRMKQQLEDFEKAMIQSEL